MSSTGLQMLLICAATITQISTQLLNATVGGSVLIPCSLTGDQLSLKWFYWQESENLVFHWDNRGNLQQVAEKYKNRCLKSGNISIILDSVTVEDDQKTFRVYVSLYDEQKKVPKPPEQMCQSKLQVSAPYQHLDLTVNSTANRATCTARGGYPEPQISWTGRNKSSAGQLDLQDLQDLQDAETSLQQDPTRKTFTFTSSVSVKQLQSVSCSVRNPRANQSVHKTVTIDEDQEETNYWIIVITVILLIVFILIFNCLWCHRERINCCRRSQQTGRETSASHADAPVESISLSTNQAEDRRRTVSTDEDSADPPDAAAGEQKENLLKNGNVDEGGPPEGVEDK